MEIINFADFQFFFSNFYVVNFSKFPQTIKIIDLPIKWVVFKKFSKLDEEGCYRPYLLGEVIGPVYLFEHEW